MNNGKAMAIFRNIESADYTVEEKDLAIYQVMNMETHNSITKQQLINAMKWLFNVPFIVEKDES